LGVLRSGLNDGAWNGGTFFGVGDDTPFFALGKQWKVNYNDTTPGANFASEALDNAAFVTLTVVPEASLVIPMGLTRFCAVAPVYLRKRSRPGTIVPGFLLCTVSG
jgi:hypothetical protein